MKLICRFQGDDTLDPDLPTYFEAWLFQSRIGKVFYIIAQPLLYAVRPLLRVPKPYTLLEVANLLIELTFDAAIYYFLGWKSLVYLLFGTILGLGLHPISGHFISGKKIFTEENSSLFVSCFSRTLYLRRRIRNLFILWTFELLNIQRWLS